MSAGRWTRETWKRFRLRAARLGVWPAAPRPRALRAVWRRASPLQRGLALLLLTAWVVWLATWIGGSRDWLFDPLLQNDDVRVSLFAFHRFGPEEVFSDDPIAHEMGRMTPPGVAAFYAIATAPFGLFVAVKIAQGLSLGIVFLAAAGTLRRRSGGLIVALGLIFLALHHPFLINRAAGGLPRAFSIPLLIAWSVALLDHTWGRRLVCGLAAALIYPPTAALLLASECTATAMQGFGDSTRRLKRRWAATATLVVPTLLVLVITSWPSSPGSGLATLAEAEAAGVAGRQAELPLAQGIAIATGHAALHLSPPPTPGPGESRFVSWHRGQRSALALALVALVAFALATRLTAGDRLLLALPVAATLLHLLATWTAFRLYVPERYLTHGIAAAGVVALAVFAARAAPGLAEPRRSLVRCATALLLGAAMIALTGPGAAGRNGMMIDARELGGLVSALKTIPASSLVLAHPLDGDHAPFWAARSSFTGAETMVPWRLSWWHRSLDRAELGLDLLYSTDRAQAVALAREQGITHLLLHQGRFGPQLPDGALAFEPLDTRTRELLSRRPTGHVLATVPGSAVLFAESPWLLVDVERLAEAWRTTGSDD